MTALDLGTADRTLTVPSSEFTSLAFGDQTLTPTTSPHPVNVVDGIAGIPRAQTAGASDINSGSSATAAVNGALFVAIRGALDTSDYYQLPNAPIAYYQTALKTGSVEWAYAHETEIVGSTLSLTTAHDSGVTVYAIVNNSTAAFLANNRDGVLASVSRATVAASGTNTVIASVPSFQSIDVELLGMWFFDDTDVSTTDATDTIDAIVAALTPVTVEFTGDGGWGITGAAAFEVGDLPDPPVPTIPDAGGSRVPPAKPTPATPSELKAAGVSPIRHVWETMPAPTLDGDYLPVDWTPTASGNDEYAYLQIVVEGVDITMLSGIETPFPQIRRGEPFGSQSAIIELPQITGFHPVPAWARHGANVSIDLVKIGGGTVSLFDGLAMDIGRREDAAVFSLECLGVLFAADLTLRPPSFTTAPQDIGTLIPALLNGVTSRRWLDMAQVATGIRTSVAGGGEPLLTGYIQELLATAIKNGRQYTVTCEDRTPVLELKDTTTIAWTVRNGWRGVAIDLNSDASQACNIIYGQGTAPDGGRWRNVKYPNWHPDDTPAYPNNSASDTMKVGRTDASTDSGSGVSDFERKLGLTPDGYYSQSDRQAVVRAQRRLGITVDGIVGPQTWAAIFDTGANTGSLDGAFQAPIAYADEVMPRLWGPDGDDIGANPAYDEDVVPVERLINYGQGVTKADGIANAEEVLVRDSVPGWQGLVSWELDPSDRSRFELREGENGRILDWHGEDVDVHVASVRMDEAIVTLEVDTQARDYPTLQAIRTRDRDAVDPAKVAARTLLEGKIQADRPTYDAESPAGRIPKHAVFGGLWDVRRIPMGAYGRVVRSEFRTTNSARAFALAVFGKQLTAADLVATIGNPLSAGTNPWATYGDELDDLGMLQAWGWGAQPAGYYPNSYSNPDGQSSAPITGRMVDEASWDFASESSPWIWVAAIATHSCFIEGRLFGAPLD